MTTIEEKRTLRQEFTKGLVAENPTLRLVLGTCPTLAVTTSVVNALGMGISATLILLCSNICISAIRRLVPDRIRIPAYIVVIASFSTMVQMLVKAFVPVLDKSLGVFLPLIVVNCIILGRAEAFARKNTVLASAADGLGMGIGFTAALLCMGTIREILGAGTFLGGAQSLLSIFGENALGGFDGFRLIPEGAFLQPMIIFILAPGGYFVFGLLIALSNKLAGNGGKTKAGLGCAGCPMAANCSLPQKEKCKTEVKPE